VDLQRLLAENGWQLVVVWEHEALDDAVDRISRAIADASS
jgi:G:T-mismatch repair DNA endonuclease (very short patch repair protein)